VGVAGPAAVTAAADRDQAWVRDLVEAAEAISREAAQVEPVVRDRAADSSIGRKEIDLLLAICRIRVAPARAFSAPAAGKLPAEQVRARTLAVAPAARGPALARVRADVHRKDN
jgi:hypothetical protein